MVGGADPPIVRGGPLELRGGDPFPPPHPKSPIFQPYTLYFMVVRPLHGRTVLTLIITKKSRQSTPPVVARFFQNLYIQQIWLGKGPKYIRKKSMPKIPWMNICKCSNIIRSPLNSKVLQSFRSRVWYFVGLTFFLNRNGLIIRPSQRPMSGR